MKINDFKKHKLPDTPGVYFFLNNQKKIIYIGKATSLVDRVRSYFSTDLINTRGKLIVKMVEEATSIDYKTTESVLEALLLEADLIKKFRPTYNTKEKDDKSFLCIAFTREDFPRLITIRKKDVEFDLLKTKDYKLSTVYGPYTSGTQLKEALKIIKKIFPYADEKCFDKGSIKNKTGKPCFNRQIGLCPGLCTGEVTKKEYIKTIKYLRTLLEGKVTKLVVDLEKEMKSCAKAREFEKASAIKNKIYALTHIHDISLIKNDYSKDFKLSDSVFRIESYDIAHMSGGNMVGVMTVVTNGEIDKSQYRKFKIKTIKSSNDTGALKEVVLRRLNHTEWQMPNLVVVDGGVAQLNMVKSVFENSGFFIPVVSVVKDERHQPKDVLGDQTLAIRYRKEILLSNAEAHRFAIRYHKKIRNKSFLE